jgi:hypothetical protein
MRGHFALNEVSSQPRLEGSRAHGLCVAAYRVEKVMTKEKTPGDELG